MISSTLWVKEPIFRILKSFLLSKSQGRQFLVLVINLERKMGPQEGDRIEAAVRTTPYSIHFIAEPPSSRILAKENLPSEEKMQNNRVEEMNK